MTRIFIAIVTLWIVGSPMASAQTHAPYAGLEARPIKALSPEQIEDLRAGKGMGLALAAELNGYPGPMHVLELTNELGLTADQHAQVQSLFAAMKAEAIPIGKRLVAQEAELDRAFASRTVTSAGLERLTAAIGETQAALRNAHLKYHLSTAALLEPGQVARYGQLRGYAAGSRGSGHGQHHRRTH